MCPPQPALLSWGCLPTSPVSLSGGELVGVGGRLLQWFACLPVPGLLTSRGSYAHAHAHTYTSSSPQSCSAALNPTSLPPNTQLLPCIQVWWEPAPGARGQLMLQDNSALGEELSVLMLVTFFLLRYVPAVQHSCCVIIPAFLLTGILLMIFIACRAEARCFGLNTGVCQCRWTLAV